jgi:hypothetical protein
MKSMIGLVSFETSPNKEMERMGDSVVFCRQLSLFLVGRS